MNPAFHSPTYPFERVQGGFLTFRGAEEIPHKLLTYLMDLPLPEDELVVTVKRDDTFFIPNGRSKLYLNDKLMIISHSKKNPDTEVPDSNAPSEPAS